MKPNTNKFKTTGKVKTEQQQKVVRQRQQPQELRQILGWAKLDGSQFRGKQIAIS